MACIGLTCLGYVLSLFSISVALKKHCACMVYTNGCGSHPLCCDRENGYECLCFCGTHSSANKSTLGVLQQCLVCFFCCFTTPLIAPPGQFKGDSWVHLGYEPEFWVAHRVAPCICFCICLFPIASAPPPSWGELSAHNALVPSMYLGGDLILLCWWACMVELGLNQMG